MFTVGLGLLGATIIFMIFQQNAMMVLVGFGFGGSLAALFMRIGGGIFTKAADVGADLVGKVEAGIPEDDPRNAATIADNVGDNVGDCAGMAADVFESYEVTLVAAIILAAAVGSTLQTAGFGSMLAQRVIHRRVHAQAGHLPAAGPRGRRGRLDHRRPGRARQRRSEHEPDEADQRRLLHVGGHRFPGISGRVVVGIRNIGCMPPIPADADPKLRGVLQNFWWLAFLATFFGIVLTQIIGKMTEYFTAVEKKPVTEIAVVGADRPGDTDPGGLSEGLESSVWGIVAIAATIFGAYMLFPDPAMAAYAIALAGLGLLTTTGYVLAMDTYGPISDNANGIFEMSGALKNADGSENKAAHNIVSRLDMVGNTTKALTKGFAIATAVIAAVSLYRSFIDTVAGDAIADDPGQEHPGQPAGRVHRPADRRRGAVPVLLLRHPRGQPRGGAAGGGSSPPVPHDPRHLGIHRRRREGQAGLRALRGDLHRGGAEGTARPRAAGGLRADPGRLLARRRMRWAASWRARSWPASSMAVFMSQHRRRVGQRQEEDRGRHLRRQGHARRTRRASSATRSAIRSRTPPARR